MVALVAGGRRQGRGRRQPGAASRATRSRGAARRCVAAAAPARRLPADALMLVRRHGALGPDGGRARVPPRAVGAYVTERKQFGRPIAASRPSSTTSPLLAGHTAAAGHRRRRTRSAAADRRRRGLRDRGGQGADGRGGRPRRGHRASVPRGHRLHLRALAALRHAPALVVARRVRRREPTGRPRSAARSPRAAPTRSGRTSPRGNATLTLPSPSVRERVSDSLAPGGGEGRVRGRNVATQTS